jgi:hypothetical protein
MVDCQFTGDSGVADFNEQVWGVLRERGHLMPLTEYPQSRSLKFPS